MKLCVLFPGIGYHCDKPLLYYTNKLARGMGYEVIPLKFSGFENGTKGNRNGNAVGNKMRTAAAHALGQAREQLAEVDLAAYERVVFVGKSIGTAACLAYREECSVSAEAVLLTPLALTFGYPADNCTAFHGTADPWADTAEIRRLCEKNGVPLYTYDNANHSLETGDIPTDIEILSDTVRRIGERLK